MPPRRLPAHQEADLLDLAATRRAHGTPHDAIAQELHQRAGIPLLWAHRLARGWRTRQQAVDAYREVCARRGLLYGPRGELACKVDTGSFLRWETGKVIPDWPALDILCELYGTRPDRLGFGRDYSEGDGRAAPAAEQVEPGRALVERGTGKPAGTAALAAPEPDAHGHDPGGVPTPPPSPAARSLMGREVSSQRGDGCYWHDRMQGGNSGAAGCEMERQVEMAARRARQFAITAAGTNVRPETLAQLWDEVRVLATSYPREPLPTLLGGLVDLQDLAFRLLEGRQRPDQTKDLYLLAGVVSGLLAKASHDLGNPPAAMTQARTAYVCADNANHDGLRAWVRGLQSLVAYWAGWPNEAVRYAQLGAGYAERVTGTVRVWLPALEARAWAVLGNADTALAAIERARAAREQVQPDVLDQLGGLLVFPLPKQLYYAADALVWLPQERERAEREAEGAVAAYQSASPEEWAFSDEAGASADLALARARRGEVDGAREALGAVLDLPPEQRIHGVVASVLRVHAELRHPRYSGSPTARDVQQAIEAFCRTPVMALQR